MIYIDWWLSTLEKARFKTLIIDGEELLYRKDTDSNGHDYSWDITTFYVPGPKKEVTKWSWRKFKRIGTGEFVDSYKSTFNVQFWIEEPNRTKGTVKSKIQHSKELYGRAKEIKKGVIV